MALAAWDLVQLVEGGLTADYRFAVVSGVSGNPIRFLDRLLEQARLVLGYVQLDAAVP